MIVRPVDGQLWLFHQRDHSALCGAMAQAWGAAPFSPVPPSVQLAAEIHDCGWPEWDARPRLDAATGRPHPYSHMPDEDYRAIWRRGLARAWAVGEETGLLVSLHAMRFFARKSGPQDLGLFGAQRLRQAESLALLSAETTDPEELSEPYATWHAWMFFWDGLSLFLCEHWESPWISQLPTLDGERQEVTVVRAGEAEIEDGADVRIAPYPFTAPLRLEASARVIADRAYASQEELDAAVEQSDHRGARWRIGPAEAMRG